MYLNSLENLFIHSGTALPLLLTPGLWYLLCLPGGYLFLIIYSFCNLNDRSWGTRQEAAKKSSGQADGWAECMQGCGRRPKVS